MTSYLNKTHQTYCSPEGAAAFIAKETPYGQERNARVFKIIEDLNLSDKKILDVGCGFGRDTLYFRQKGAEAYGIDISAELLKKPLIQHPHYFAVHNILDNEPLPFPAPFDLIWASAFFVHIPKQNLKSTLLKLWGNLASGGHLIIFTKLGQGEEMKYNLGENLDRLMVYYQRDDFLSILTPLGAKQDVIEEKLTQVESKDTFFTLRLLKP